MPAEMRIDISLHSIAELYDLYNNKVYYKLAEILEESLFPDFDKRFL
jgi:hypothetical protein